MQRVSDTLLEEVIAAFIRLEEPVRSECFALDICNDLRDARAEIARMRPVVDSAKRAADHWRGQFGGTVGLEFLAKTVDTYNAARSEK